MTADIYPGGTKPIRKLCRLGSTEEELLDQPAGSDEASGEETQHG